MSAYGRYGSIFRHPTYVLRRGETSWIGIVYAKAESHWASADVCVSSTCRCWQQTRGRAAAQEALQRVKRQHQGRQDSRPTSNIDTLAADTRSAVKARSCRPQLVSGRPYLLSGLFRVSRWGRAVAASSGVPPPHCTFPLEGLSRKRSCGAPVEIPMIWVSCLRKLECLVWGNTHGILRVCPYPRTSLELIFSPLFVVSCRNWCFLWSVSMFYM